MVGAISAWNSPLMLVAYKLAPALAAGCTFVLKPSEHTPVSALYFAEIFAEAGFPDGVFNVVTGDGPTVGEPLGVASRRRQGGVHRVNRHRHKGGQGGRRAPRQGVAGAGRQVGQHRVCNDADMEAAVNGVVAGIFAACGQTCVAGSRLLVQRDVHDEVVGRVVERARRIKLGDPMELETEMGPLAFEAQFDKVMRYIGIGAREGAEIATGGRRPEQFGDGLLVEPTVFTGVDNRMTIAREEIFGPVLSVIPFEGEDEAVAVANDSTHGLAAGVWTRDIQRAHRMVPRLQVGTVWVNAYRVIGREVPFGGYKMSGYGRENGMEGLREYQHTKAVWIETSGNTRDPFKLG